MNITFEQESVYALTDQNGKKHRFTVKSEWNGLTELRDEIGAILIVAMPRKVVGFSVAFGDIFGDIFGGSPVGGVQSMTIISGTPGLIEKFKPRGAQSSVAPQCPGCGGSGFYCGDERAGACSTCKGEIKSTTTENP